MAALRRSGCDVEAACAELDRVARLDPKSAYGAPRAEETQEQYRLRFRRLAGWAFGSAMRKRRDGGLRMRRWWRML
jgi:hypothetical protein